jgi:AcrR family transcriptional regulator
VRRQQDAHVRRAVCQAAHRLVEASPFTDVTVGRLSRAAGLSRSSFYLHFRDKYDVLRAMTEDIADELYAEADRWWHGEGPPEELVREALEGVVSIYALNAAVLGTVAEVSMYDDDFRAFWGRVVGRFVSATADHLRRERVAGRSRAVDPDATADVLVWMTERSFYIHLVRGAWSQHQVVEALLAVWLATVYGDGASA